MKGPLKFIGIALAVSAGVYIIVRALHAVSSGVSVIHAIANPTLPISRAVVVTERRAASGAGHF